jgi:hypothetical protein
MRRFLIILFRVRSLDAGRLGRKIFFIAAILLKIQGEIVGFH